MQLLKSTTTLSCAGFHFHRKKLLQSFTEQYFNVNKRFWENWVKFNCYKTSPCTCTLKAYCIFDICTVWVGHNLLTSFISKLSQVYTQANSHGEVAKIQPAWSSQRNYKLCTVMFNVVKQSHYGHDGVIHINIY